MIRALVVVGVFALVSCGQPDRAAEGSYGASSGPNLNDPQAAEADETPTYDEPAAAAGSEFGEPTRPEIAEDQAQQSAPATP